MYSSSTSIDCEIDMELTSMFGKTLRFQTKKDIFRLCFRLLNVSICVTFDTLRAVQN